MNKQNSSFTSKKTKLFAVTSALVIVGAATALALTLTNDNKTQAESTKAQSPSVNSPFTFNSGQASGWRQGPTNQDSMALFSNDHSCFISIEHKGGKVDSAAATSKTLASLSEGGYITKALGTATASIKVNSDDTELAIDKFDITGSGNAGQLYSGQAYGYTQLDNSYLHAQANCNSADRLSSAISALSAITFKDK